MAMGGAVAAGAFVGAVALAGSSPSSAGGVPIARESSLTPRSTLSLSPNSSSEELRLDAACRKSILHYDDHENTFLQAPNHDDSSTSPSPNKLHKTPWGKMRDIIQTRRESVRKKSRGTKNSPEMVSSRRRSMSDGGDSDAPPVLTLTIPSSEELESEYCVSHPVLRKQRSLELSVRPPQQRPPRASKWSKVKKAFLSTTSASVPSSPSRHSAFFTDAENDALSSGCEASGVREEIARDYAALQSKLRQEFSEKDKLYAASRPVATEEQLSVDFRKKLTDWQRMKGVRQPPPVPARQDLSEDFLKRWDEWKVMKETNSVPAWEEEAKPDEVLVQTSTGLFKFQGISRSFTRKLHEWEKSRGIAPEASTSALLRAARSRVAHASGAVGGAPLMRTQSDGSVAPSVHGSGRVHDSSLSVNDADDFGLTYEHDQDYTDGDETRGAVLVEVEDEEICTAAPLVAVRPRHTPQKPVYTYGQAEARLLCETNSPITDTALMKTNVISHKHLKLKETHSVIKNSRQDQVRKKIVRQPSIEEDAKFIRKTIREIERSSSTRLKSQEDQDNSDQTFDSKSKNQDDDNNEKSDDLSKTVLEDLAKKREAFSANGKKKSRSRIRLERELSKPSESDTEIDVDTVTVDIPKRRKKSRKTTDKPKTPPIHTDSEGEVFVLKLRASEPREDSPEVIVKTTRKIFTPVMRSGDSVPRAVIPLNVEDFVETKTGMNSTEKEIPLERLKDNNLEYLDIEEQKCFKSKPPLPLSPNSQRKPLLAKETSPSIRIMIQRYNKKINEEGLTSGASSGTSSPAWRSPATERRRPPDMPVGVNIRKNPFLEMEVQKSASACQLSRREPNSSDKTVNVSSDSEGVLKSLSANTLHQENGNNARNFNPNTSDCEPSGSGFNNMASVALDLTKIDTRNVVDNPQQPHTAPILLDNMNYFEKSLQEYKMDSHLTRLSERANKIREAREKFLNNTFLMRRDGVSSTSDLIPADRNSHISYESDLSEVHCDGFRSSSTSDNHQEEGLPRCASTGMVNVTRDTWERVAAADQTIGGEMRRRRRPRFSLARLAAKLRRRDDGAVSSLCRQSLLVQLKNKQ